VLGCERHTFFSLYEAPKAYDRVRQGTDELSFPSGTEIADQKLDADVLPGPTAFVITIGVMVPKGSTAHRLDEVSDTTVCLMIGSIGQRAPEMRRPCCISPSVGGRLPLGEDVEMLDAYNAGRCGAVVGEGRTWRRCGRIPACSGGRAGCWHRPWLQTRSSSRHRGRTARSKRVVEGSGSSLDGRGEPLAAANKSFKSVPVLLADPGPEAVSSEGRLL
jgi:hypothetical protein